MITSDIQYDLFRDRHIGPAPHETQEMLRAVGTSTLDELIYEVVPDTIRMKEELPFHKPISEYDYLYHLKQLLQKNKPGKSYIGQGYYPTVLPPVIQRTILENPGWYTQYTPYQAEIAQGRLEALINYQTMVTDLTGLPVSNASLLDEATAAAEAMQMAFSSTRGSKKGSNVFFVDRNVFAQTLSVLSTRAVPLGITLQIGDFTTFEPDSSHFGVYVQYPSANGEIYDYSAFVQRMKTSKLIVVMGTDLLALLLLKSPGELGADIAVGSAQRFGVPMGYGGPHAAFMACKDELKRIMPGRIIGASIDSQGKLGYRMALQTREQHIRREKATSNICTAQVLLAILAGMYAVYHGPSRLKNIASGVFTLTSLLKKHLSDLGLVSQNIYHFDTLTYTVENPQTLQKIAESKDCHFFYNHNQVSISLSETTSLADVQEIVTIFSEFKELKIEATVTFSGFEFPEPSFTRTDLVLQHAKFNSYHSETAILRYIKKLEKKDLSLCEGMIALGSCTMKLNAAAEMLVLTDPNLANMHPFLPREKCEGYYDILKEVEQGLKAVTGFSAVSLQPNSGAQGEYTGLLVIRAYHQQRNDQKRNIALIPSSAHGTNPASAVMAGMKVVIVECDTHGNIDIADLKLKAEQYKETLACLMVTYPSTHGVFETGIKEICEIIHVNGGLVYMDGANMNAQVGLTSPGIIGADVCHINLHKTFAIPHGGGGPGMGPICVNDKLAPFLPTHPLVSTGGEHAIDAVSAAPFGSASILIISLGYMKMLGAGGMKTATEYAILNANYIKSKLEKYYPVLYSGERGRVAHEMIFDFREFKKSAMIEVEDVAKRLIDYGFHAPTVSFPVPGTLMIEPTESENKEELDRFIEAMIKIREEIDEVITGKYSHEDNVLKNSPHTMEMIASDTWTHSYTREKAAYPVASLRRGKFWASTGRIQNAYGDRNLICSCNDIREYTEPITEEAVHV